MRMVLTGIVAAILVAAGLGYFLAKNPTLAWQAFSTANTRVDDPGHNLVGPRWTGVNSVTAAESDNKSG